MAISLPAALVRHNSTDSQHRIPPYYHINAISNNATTTRQRIPTHRITTGECPFPVSASPFDDITICSISINSLNLSCLVLSARSYPMELIKYTLGTLACFLASTTSFVMSILDVCAGGMMQMASAPVCFGVWPISLARPGLCSMIFAPSFWSSLHLGKEGSRARQAIKFIFLEKVVSVRRNPAIR
jgi:hypothetical protein